ncbi:MAG: hypothetical protein ACRD4W_11335 [Nitrososphaeraceae archaeon]
MSYQIKTEFFLRTSNSDTLLVSNLAARLSKTFDLPEAFHFPLINSGILKWANLELDKRRLKKRSIK